METNPKTSARLLYRRCWEAAHHNDLPTLLKLADDISLDAEMLSVIAPGYQDRNSDVGLVGRVLDHPACSAGIVGRYTTHPDAGIRLRVATHPGAPSTALEMLTLDSDEEVRATAIARLTTQGNLPSWCT